MRGRVGDTLSNSKKTCRASTWLLGPRTTGLTSWPSYKHLSLLQELTFMHNGDFRFVSNNNALSGFAPHLFAGYVFFTTSCKNSDQKTATPLEFQSMLAVEHQLSNKRGKHAFLHASSNWLVLHPRTLAQGGMPL